MSWLRVDDLLPDHPKADGLERACGDDVALLGAAWMCWLHLGCDCARRRTDGRFTIARAQRAVRLPAELVERAVAALFAAGLLERTVDGYAFHDWADYQPTRAQLDEERAAKTERQRRWRESRARVDASTAPSTDASTRRLRDATVDASTGASTAPSRQRSTRASVDAAPSQPVPTPKEETRAGALEERRAAVASIDAIRAARPAFARKDQTP